jgi:CRISPR-associated protein Csc1
MNVVEVVIETQGRVAFAAREIGRTVDTGEYLLNTALHYAFGFASGRYIDTKHKPTYVEDTEEAIQQVYVSPAEPLASPDYLTTIYNARGDRYATVNYDATEDPDQDKNLPRFGRERVFRHGNLFRSYLIPHEVAAEEIAESLPRYVRLGKKRGKAKLHVRTVEAQQRSGEFVSNHPFGAYDYDGTPLGSVVSKQMRPTPLILQAEYEDDHLVIPRGEDERPARIPAGLQFLRRKR